MRLKLVEISPLCPALSSSQLSTTEPSSYDSTGSFFLHDPSTLGYNRLSDLFSSSVAHTVCSDDSGVDGLNSHTPVCSANSIASTSKLQLTRPKQKPPKPPIESGKKLDHSLLINLRNYIKFRVRLYFCRSWRPHHFTTSELQRVNSYSLMWQGVSAPTLPAKRVLSSKHYTKNQHCNTRWLLKNVSIAVK